MNLEKDKWIKWAIDILAVSVLMFFGYFFIFETRNINALNGDAGNGYYAVLAGNASIIMNGEVPLWNPYLWGGFSNIGHIYGGFYPVLWILYFVCWNAETQILSYMILPIYYCIHIMIAGIGLYCLLRNTVKNQLISWSCASLGIFCGCMLYGYHWAYLFVGFCWIPFFLLFYMKTLENEKVSSYKWGSLAGVTLGMIGMSSTSHGLLFAGLVMFFLFISYVTADIKNTGTLLKKSFYVGLCGLGIAAVQLIPFIEFMTRAFRYVPTATGVVDYAAFIEHIVPATEIHKMLGGHTGFYAMSAFLTLLAAISWFEKREKVTPLIICARIMWVFSILMMSGTVLVDLVFYIPGYNAIREQFLYSPYLAISSSIMAAHLMNDLYEKLKGKDIQIYPMGYFIAVILFVISVLPVNREIRFSWYIVMALTLGIFVLYFIKQIPLQWKNLLFSIMCILLVLGDYRLYRTNNDKELCLNPEEADWQVEQVNLTMEEIRKELSLEEGERMLKWGAASAYPSNIGAAVGFGDCLAYMNPVWKKTVDIHSYTDLTKRCKLQNIRYYISSSNDTEELNGWLSVISQDENPKTYKMYPTYDDKEVSEIYAYENEPLGSGWLVYNCKFYNDEMAPADVMGSISNEEFDPSYTALVNEKMWDSGYAVESEGSISEVSLESYRANLVKFNVNTDTNAILVTSEFAYPGWHVYIDGKKADLLEVNYAFRGVYVLGGEHEVEFRFLPLSFILGLICLIGTAAVMIFNMLRKETKQI